MVGDVYSPASNRGTPPAEKWGRSPTTAYTGYVTHTLVPSLAYGTTGDTTEDRKQSLYEEGIQNILNYGMEQMRNRGDGN